MQLIFATNNTHKIAEIKAALPSGLSIITLKEAGIDQEIPEPFDSLEENAAAKAKTIHELTGANCFSEDTGLEVAALNNAPGVHSARYAGEERSFEKNTSLLLHNLKGEKDRSARFRTVICLIWEGQLHYFEGICKGQITEEVSGAGGFGYDPVFIPDGSDSSFASMSMEEKNRFSHRKKALDKLVVFLNNLIK
jgi:XTP/dITP diphosphohydrolase